MADPKKARSKAPANAAKILERCRDIVLIFSDSQMSEMFENVGNALMEFAERAENNTMQGRFFEAMNIIQQKRPEIEYEFRQHLSQGFTRFGQDPGNDKGGPTYSEDSGLSLVEQEEMEEMVASENIIFKATNAFFQELYALRQRFAVLNGGQMLTEKQVPAGPHQLTKAFRHAIRDLGVETKIKIILYALFNKYIVQQARVIYDEINSTLKDEGILPNLKPIPRSTSVGGAEQPTQEETLSLQKKEEEGEKDPHEELMDSIVDLMSTRKGAKRKEVPPEVAKKSAEQLVGALDNLQSNASTQDITEIVKTPGGVPNLEVDPEFLEKLKSTLDAEREKALSQIDQDKLSQVDSDLIDLIGMLFEYMLNDPVLPNIAKALLSHLHTPYLKVALIDQRLLVDTKHPARRLLDNLVEAGSLWIDEAHPERGIFPTMQQVVDRVLQDFSNDISLFEELLKSFEAEMAEQQRRTTTIEQRTQEAARGREKLQLAKKRATYQIQLLLKQYPLPEAVIAFLTKTWQDQLVFILLRDKHGERGDAWQNAVRIGETLVQLFDPKLDKTQREKRIRAIPKLKEIILKAVRQTGSYSRSIVDGLFEFLEDPNSWRAQGAHLKTVAPPQEAEAVGEEEGGTTPAGQVPQENLTEQEQAVIKRLRKMKFGTWFEFTSAAGVAPRRIKLSWLSPLTSTCMFVDRAGQQAEIKTLQELAQEILAGHAKVIPRPKHPFIERAMVSIQKMLGSEEPSADRQHSAKS